MSASPTSWTSSSVRGGGRGRRCTILCATALCAALLFEAAPARAQWPPDSLTNLQVLPADIPTNELVGMMAGFTRALGVRCTHCHVGEEGRPLATYDFPSDEKEAKRKARVMLRMVREIGDHLSDLPARSEPAVRVDCFTCHRGSRTPRSLQDTLRIAYANGGIDRLESVYRQLREGWYGRAAFDFGEVPLADVGGEIGATPAGWADAERVHALNVEMNPSSRFAGRQLAGVAVARAFAESDAAGRARISGLAAAPGPEAVQENVLNAAGYALLRAGDTAGAVALFRYVTEAHPDSWNAWDSLGEGLATDGDVDAAIAAYERSLTLNPQNANGRERLEALRRR